MSGYKIAIDGPAGSGKSTISQLLAKKLHMTHIDTGAMYRAVTLKALQLNIDLEQEENYKFLEDVNIKYQKNKIYIDNINVTKQIRSDAVTKNVSLVSSIPYVRKMMVSVQRKAADGDIVMDGRDIGTVVLPDADLKIFLTANIEERAKRRYKENIFKGKSMEETIKDLEIRDEKDSNRLHSPLKKADDAIILDTTNLTIREVVNKIISLSRKKENNHGV